MRYSEYQMEQTVGQFMQKVYGWMSFALAMTAAVAYYISTTDFFLKLVANPLLLMVIVLAELGLVVFISAAIQKIDYSTAVIAYMTYAFLNGVTLASVFFIYTEASIYSTFLTTAGMFAALSIYGYFTKADLTSVGSISFMVLIGLIIAQFVNMFFRSAQFEYMISFIGVIVFSLLTAYDVQKIKRLYMQLYGSGQNLSKVALLGALTLYLDFINLFLFLLRLLGRRRD
ncbi:Bax inhibitor-1/YccA family protein [bacterium]|jgi:uncharacterized protein|nr:Bax inhibitor-1/YccA family protein [bacterium]